MKCAISLYMQYVGNQTKEAMAHMCVAIALAIIMNHRSKRLKHGALVILLASTA